MTMRTLLDALREVLLAVGEDNLEAGPEETWDGEPAYCDVSAHTLIGGESTLVLAVSEPVALHLVRRMGGLDVKFEDRLIPDVVAELLNITTGRAQRELGGRFSIPVACCARRHEVSHLEQGCRRVVAEYVGGEIALYLVDRAAA